MPEEVVYCQNGDISDFKTQKLSKPKPEEFFSKYLDSDTEKSALDFVNWLRENKMSPRWTSSNSWTVRYKNKTVCHFDVNSRGGPNAWQIRHGQFTRENWFRGYEKYVTDDELKKFILDNIKAPGCIRDDGRCEGVRNFTVLGKHFDNVCHCWPLSVNNPSGKTLENSKKFILLIKNMIADLNA